MFSCSNCCIRSKYTWSNLLICSRPDHRRSTWFIRSWDIDAELGLLPIDSTPSFDHGRSIFSSRSHSPAFFPWLLHMFFWACSLNVLCWLTYTGSIDQGRMVYWVDGIWSNISMLRADGLDCVVGKIPQILQLLLLKNIYWDEKEQVWMVSLECNPSIKCRCIVPYIFKYKDRYLF